MVTLQEGTEVANSTRLLEMHDVSFGYGRQPLLYHVSLQLCAGEMVGLLGPNGSGKTTLLRLLTGVLRPRQGNILFEGRDVQHWGRRRLARRIAVVPQEFHLSFAFTVEHMVSLGRTPFVKPFLGARSSQDRRIVEEAMEAAGVTVLAHRAFNELSGGERQRVLIAMALAQQPSLLLLDEPTSHLDMKYQIETLELVQQLNKERGVTVVAAMHDLNLAARYFPRLLLFQRGVVADGSPAEVLEPALLSRVYGVEVRVGILRGAEHLSVLPPDKVQDEYVLPGERLSPRIHVICGGGSGELLMRALADAHLAFSAGALNIGDSDHTLALRLADEVITEQPYSPISLKALEQVRVRLTQSSLLIICPTPIGPGNLVLLNEAVAAAQEGLPVVLLARTDEATVCLPGAAIETDDGMLPCTGMVARDYTNGEGLKLMGRLLQTGAVVTEDVSGAVDFARRYVEATHERESMLPNDSR